MSTHPVVEVEHPDGQVVDVDEELAPLIAEIWRAGIDTIDCCQDVGETWGRLRRWLPHIVDRPGLGRAQIGIATTDLCRFYEALANAGPRGDFYVRMVHWVAPGAWERTVSVEDVGVDDADSDDPVPSVFAVSDAIHLTFPRSDIDEMYARMQTFNLGGLPEPGEIDWSSIEVEG